MEEKIAKTSKTSVEGSESDLDEQNVDNFSLEDKIEKEVFVNGLSNKNESLRGNSLIFPLTSPLEPASLSQHVPHLELIDAMTTSTDRTMSANAEPTLSQTQPHPIDALRAARALARTNETTNWDPQEADFPAWSNSRTLVRHHAKSSGGLPGAHNPSYRAPPLSYAGVFSAALHTIPEIDIHEYQIYQHGYSPHEIRSSIKQALSMMVPADEHIVPFKAEDIVPARLDPSTHNIMARFYKMREETGQALVMRIAGQTPNPASADISHLNLDQPLHELDQLHNHLNKHLFSTYANSKYIVHENNFMTYCKPHLRHLPTVTPHALQAQRDRLQTDEIQALTKALDSTLDEYPITADYGKDKALESHLNRKVAGLFVYPGG